MDYISDALIYLAYKLMEYLQSSYTDFKTGIVKSTNFSARARGTAIQATSAEFLMLIMKNLY